jgi:hypothetical protein
MEALQRFTDTESELLELYRQYTGLVESAFVNDRDSLHKDVYQNYIQAMNTIRTLTGTAIVRPLERDIRAYIES